MSEFAGELAAGDVARDVLLPVNQNMLSSLCSRILEDADRSGALESLKPLFRMPGLPRALVRTFTELRGLANSVAHESVLDQELAGLFLRYEEALIEEGFADQAHLNRLAVRRLETDSWSDVPTLILDPDCRSPLERELVIQTASGCRDCLLVLPRCDLELRNEVELRLSREVPEQSAVRTTDLGRLQTFLFSDSSPPPSTPDGSVSLISAPGESRECVEIARRIQKAAGEGTPYDQIAVLFRAEQTYRPLLEEALRRAGIPAHFASGSSLPDVSARALLVLLR